jgi:DNA-binding response OmpR family regulator
VPPGLTAIALSPQDHAVLLAIASSPDGAPRQAIVEALGKDYLQYDRRRLDTQMRRLRRKVEDASGLKLPVLTVRGVGYRFFEPIQVLP